MPRVIVDRSFEAAMTQAEPEITQEPPSRRNHLIAHEAIAIAGIPCLPDDGVYGEVTC